MKPQVYFDRWHAQQCENFMRANNSDELLSYCENLAKWLKENKDTIDWVLE